MATPTKPAGEAEAAEKTQATPNPRQPGTFPPYLKAASHGLSCNSSNKTIVKNKENSYIPQ